MIGSQLARLYPTDASAMVMTGWSTAIQPGVTENLRLEPAAAHDPVRFRGVATGYLTTAEAAQREAAWYYKGYYDPAVAAADFAGADVVTTGEFGSLVFLTQPAVGYEGPVMAATGANDANFCPPDGTPEKCGDVLAASAASFPDAAEFAYYAPPDTGHDLSLHYSAPETLKRVHDFLDRVL